MNIQDVSGAPLNGRNVVKHADVEGAPGKGTSTEDLRAGEDRRLGALVIDKPAQVLCLQCEVNVSHPIQFKF